MRNCGWLGPGTSPILRPLPPIYGSRPVGSHRELASTVAPYGPDLGVISEAADVPVGNLRRRVVDVMHQIAPRETAWSDDVERRMRSHLVSVGIRLSYARPRVRIVSSALFRAVAELVDGGLISPQGNALLEKILRTYDPRMVLEEPSRRPTQISRAIGTPLGDGTKELGSERRRCVVSDGLDT